jgi:hypothetical protein
MVRIQDQREVREASTAPYFRPVQVNRFVSSDGLVEAPNNLRRFVDNLYVMHEKTVFEHCPSFKPLHHTLLSFLWTFLVLAFGHPEEGTLSKVRCRPTEAGSAPWRIFVVELSTRGPLL